MSFNLKWNGDAVAKEIDQGAQQGLVKAGLFLKSKSIPQAPKDMGDLRSSCYVDEDNIKKGYVEVGYSEVYALKQHEELEYKHSEGKAKYLEDPFNENSEKLQKFIAKSIGDKI